MRILCDDLLIAIGHRENSQVQMTDAEVMTTAIVAAIDFGANFEKARGYLKEGNYIPNMLSKSQFNRRGYQRSKRRYFHGVKDHLLVTVDQQLVEFFLTECGCGDVSGTMV